MMVTVYDPRSKRLRPEALKWEAVLGYVTDSRPDWATKQNYVSKKQTN